MKYLKTRQGLVSQERNGQLEQKSWLQSAVYCVKISSGLAAKHKSEYLFQFYYSVNTSWICETKWLVTHVS